MAPTWRDGSPSLPGQSRPINLVSKPCDSANATSRRADEVAGDKFDDGEPGQEATMDQLVDDLKLKYYKLNSKITTIDELRDSTNVAAAEFVGIGGDVGVQETTLDQHVVDRKLMYCKMDKQISTMIGKVSDMSTKLDLMLEKISKGPKIVGESPSESKGFASRAKKICQPLVSGDYRNQIPSTNSNYTYAGLNHISNLPNHYFKLELPTFDGNGEVEEWLLRINNFFKLYQIPVMERVKVCSVQLKGAAAYWFDGFEKIKQEKMTWEEFCSVVKKEFGPSSYIDYRIELKNLTQGGTVKEYNKEFQKISKRIVDMTEEHLINQYIEGLRDEIKYKLQYIKPSTVQIAMEVAKLQEARVSTLERMRKLKPRVSGVTVGDSTTKVVEKKSENDQLSLDLDASGAELWKTEVESSISKGQSVVQTCNLMSQKPHKKPEHAGLQTAEILKRNVYEHDIKESNRILKAEYRKAGFNAKFKSNTFFYSTTESKLAHSHVAPCYEGNPVNKQDGSQLIRTSTEITMRKAHVIYSRGVDARNKGQKCIIQKNYTLTGDPEEFAKELNNSDLITATAVSEKQKISLGLHIENVARTPFHATMRMNEVVQQKPMVIMVDSGLIHNYTEVGFCKNNTIFMLMADQEEPRKECEEANKNKRVAESKQQEKANDMSCQVLSNTSSMVTLKWRGIGCQRSVEMLVDSESAHLFIDAMVEMLMDSESTHLFIDPMPYKDRYLTVEKKMIIEELLGLSPKCGCDYKNYLTHGASLIGRRAYTYTCYQKDGLETLAKLVWDPGIAVICIDYIWVYNQHFGHMGKYEESTRKFSYFDLETRPN